MEIFLLIVMAFLLIAALERTHRRQDPHTPRLNGAHDHDDRDWARIQLDLVSLGDARPRWISTDRKGPRPA